MTQHESSHQDHERQAESTALSVGFGVLTLSDTRTTETDKSGQLIHELITEQGHTIESYAVIPDDESTVINRWNRSLKTRQLESWSPMGAPESLLETARMNP